MNSKGHLIISAVKSVLRMGSCVAACACKSLKILCIGLGLAELFGVIEELVDKR